jgi:3-hydroxybutyrate dehydrogenase
MSVNTTIKTLANKVALITGSTSGIGLGIAEALAEKGCSICINGFGENIDEIVTSMKKKYKVPVMYNGADMLNRYEIKDMIENDIKSTFGTSVDILVNNCGMQHISPIEDFDEDMFEKVIQLNLTSNFYTTKYVIKDMREKQYGRIINVASTHGKVASVHKSAYVASKHGVVGLTKTIALETATDINLTCNAICPGFVLTPLVAVSTYILFS